MIVKYHDRYINPCCGMSILWNVRKSVSLLFEKPAASKKSPQIYHMVMRLEVIIFGAKINGKVWYMSMSRKLSAPFHPLGTGSFLGICKLSIQKWTWFVPVGDDPNVSWMFNPLLFIEIVNPLVYCTGCTHFTSPLNGLSTLVNGCLSPAIPPCLLIFD